MDQYTEALTKIRAAIKTEEDDYYKIKPLDPKFYQNIIDVLRSNSYGFDNLHNELSKLSKIRRRKVVTMIAYVKKGSQLPNLTTEEHTLCKAIYEACDAFKKSTTGRSAS